MRLKGFDVKADNRLYHRNGVVGDKDLRGDDVSTGYAIFMRKSNRKMIPITYCGSWYGYGKTTVRNSVDGIWMYNTKGIEVFVHKYEQYTMYFTYKNRVYTSSVQTPIEEV